MKVNVSVRAATAALTIVACLSTPVTAGGLLDRGGSMKDDYTPYMRNVSTGGAGPCYFRADVGYSLSSDPSISWPVNRITNTYAPGTTQAQIDAGATPTATNTAYVGDAVTNTSMDNTWFGEGGFGCGSGSNGFRGELMFGIRGSRDIVGTPQLFTVTNNVSPPPNFIDPLHTSVKSYTAMFNLYRDLGNYGGFTPYIGAGIGASYNKLSQVYFTDNPNLTNKIAGNNDLSFAWALMAGVGYQMSQRAIIDFGYRYIDMGSIKSGRVDNAGFVNPAVDVKDIRAHEFKIGLRYHFGGGSSATSFK